MAIHDTLLEQLNEGGDAPASFALESRVTAITTAKCAIPTDRPALREVRIPWAREFFVILNDALGFPTHFTSTPSRTGIDGRRCRRSIELEG